MLNTVRDDLLREGFQRASGRRLARCGSVLCAGSVADPTNADAWHLSGLIAFQSQRTSDAEQFIRQALSLRPDDLEFASNLAVVLLAEGRSGRGRALVSEHPEEIAPEREMLFSILARHSIASTDFLRRFRFSRSSWHLRPGNAEALCNLGAVLSEAGQMDSAYQILSQAASIDQRLPQIYVNLGSVQRQLGRFDDALASLGKANQLSPDLAEAYTNRGNLLLGTA